MKHNITERRLIALAVLLVVFLLSPVGTLAAPASQGPTVHVVRRGETLSRIAGQYGVSVTALMQANNIANPDRIYVGQSLTIAVGDRGTSGTTSATSGGIASYTGSGDAAGACHTYTVRLGDSLSTIARQYGVTVSSIQQANGLWGSLIWPLLKLKIPCGGSAPPTATPTGGGTPTPAQGCPLVGGRYQVRPDDTLYTIARRCNTSVTVLRAANGLRSDYIWVGQWLVTSETSVPMATPSSIAVPTSTPTDAYQWSEPAAPTSTPTDAYQWSEPAAPTLPPVSTPTPTPTPTPASQPREREAMPTPSG